MKDHLMPVSSSANHYKNAGYAKAMSEVYGILADQVGLLRVEMMQAKPGSQEFHSAFKAVQTLALVSDKMKEMIDAPEQKH